VLFLVAVLIVLLPFVLPKLPPAPVPIKHSPSYEKLHIRFGYDNTGFLSAVIEDFDEFFCEETITMVLYGTEDVKVELSIGKLRI
jgi:hypothetical protein